MADNINMPSGFGGIVKFKEEFESKFNLKPEYVILFVILLVGFRIALQLFVK